MDNKEIKEGIKGVKNFFLDRRVQIGLIVLLMVAILALGTLIRVQNSSLLIDQTTEEYIPLALDPYYFMRISETIVETGGDLPAVDPLRNPVRATGWSPEILPDSTVGIFKVLNILGVEKGLGFAVVINPVVFFVLGALVFFFLIFYLTKSKWIALLSTFMLSIIPPYLYRTMMGFADHESIGMFAFFSALLVFAISLRIGKKKSNLTNNILLGLLLGLVTTFTIISWGGVAKFLFMIIPLGFLVYWLVHCKEKDSGNKIWFYGLWLVSVLLFNSVFGIAISETVRRYLLNAVGFFSLLVLGIIIIDYLMIKYLPRVKSKISEDYRVFFSTALTIVLGGILYQIFVGNVFHLFGDILSNLVTPFGSGRVGLTVAENKQPFLTDWIGQIGKIGFWIFFLGVVLVGNNISNSFSKKRRWLFFVSWVVFISGILFTRISSGSVLNGTNFISKALYFLSFLFFFGSALYIYVKEKNFNIETNLILIAAWMIPMLITARSAVRLFFAIVPFAAFMIVYALFELYKLFKQNKGDLEKLILFVVFLLVLVSLFSVANNYIRSDLNAAKATGPSADALWQQSMGWVRDNTESDGLFLHWWDYGYWVQTLGERQTFSDGGHIQGEFGNHLVGRYVLTTPYPETAKSFMKTWDVDYFLIDRTDIGKYTAYSSIGTDEEKDDRTSWIQSLLSENSDVQETRNGTIRVYRGSVGLDDDLIYEEGNYSLYFAKEKSALIGSVVVFDDNGSVQSAEGIYYNNGQQERVPIRYVFHNDEIHDFGSGINSTLYIYPRIEFSQGAPQQDDSGAMMYLSERTKDSLFAQLYLMDDPNNLYPELELVYPENRNAAGIYYYQGTRGPIKIWEVRTEEMDDILENEEFFKESGEFGELDDERFVR